MAERNSQLMAERNSQLMAERNSQLMAERNNQLMSERIYEYEKIEFDDFWSYRPQNKSIWSKI